MLKTPGIFERYKEQGIEKGKVKETPLNLLVTANLGIGQWNELLQVAKDQGVKLNITLASGVTVPKDKELPSYLLENIKKADLGDYKIQDNPCKVYLTKKEDIDQVVDNIIKNSKPKDITNVTKDIKYDEVITISEYDQSDIFYHTSVEVNKDSSQFNFTDEQCDILNKLKDGKNILLRGRISPIFAHYLASLITQGYILYNGKKEFITGKFIMTP